MQDSETPPISYRVEVSEGALGILIRVGSKSIPVAITPSQAAALGRSLIAASALLSDEAHAAEIAGPIETSDLPVSGWRTGVIRQHGLSLLETGRTLEGAAR